MSRRTKSFSQLFDYINKSAVMGDELTWNSSLSHDRETMLKEFSDNAALLPKRKNGVMLYHEIISISFNPEMDFNIQIKALQDLAYKYLELRAKKQIAYGRLHMDTSHSLHYHIMLSCNNVGEPKRQRLSRKEFREVQVSCERYIRKHYPQLQQEILIDWEQRKALEKDKTIKRQVLQSTPLDKRQQRLQQLQQIRQYHQSVEKEIDSPEY